MASPVNYEFVDKVPEDYDCFICINILTDPVQNDCCGHRFCDGCLKECLQRQKQKTCPVCRTIKFNFIKDKRMKRVIDSLKIYCPNRSKGCDKITTLGECNQHLEKCLFVCPLEPVKCPFFEAGCREMILRKDLAAHKASNTEHHLELMMTQTATLKHKANKFEQEAKAEKEAAKTTKDQLQQLSLKFDALAFCTESIKNIKSSLETMNTMLAPGDTRYYLPLVKESYRSRSASFYIKPGYKVYVSIHGYSYCGEYLEKGEHDHKLEWPMPEMEIELSTAENETPQGLYRETICTRCDLTVKRLVGDSTQKTITPAPRFDIPGEVRPINIIAEVPRDFVFLTIKQHICTASMSDERLSAWHNI